MNFFTILQGEGSPKTKLSLPGKGMIAPWRGRVKFKEIKKAGPFQP
ncbi:MAG: hypothetical protein H6Q44_1156, partial [Deltaproteobacteria bacterium]|nr:hypothetical protein [Deltaproteobacteria bacterium]